MLDGVVVVSILRISKPEGILWRNISILKSNARIL